MSEIERLADLQLEAYNRGDIDAFCACYSADVQVLDENGQVTLEGAAAFRARYAALFESHETFGEISGRLVTVPHLVERELWQRTNRTSGETQSGEVLVRYTAREGRIARVQFFRP